MNEVLWTELEKIDVLRERMNVSYEKARQTLEKAGGDLLQALTWLEKEQGRLVREWQENRREIWGQFQERLVKFNHTRFNVKHHDKVVLSVAAPLVLTLAYALWQRPAWRVLGLLGAAGAAVNHYELEVTKSATQSVKEDLAPHNAANFNASK